MTHGGKTLRDAFARQGAAGVNRWLLDHFAVGDDSHAAMIRAVLLVASGETDAAFVQMDRALTEREPALIDLAVSPLWEALRDDPRFAVRLRQIKASTRRSKVGEAREPVRST
jgi:hypothetical protein